MYGAADSAVSGRDFDAVRHALDVLRRPATRYSLCEKRDAEAGPGKRGHRPGAEVAGFNLVGVGLQPAEAGVVDEIVGHARGGAVDEDAASWEGVAVAVAAGG